MSNTNPVSWIASESSRRAKSAVAVTLSFAILLGGMAFVSWTGYGYYMNWRQRDDYIGQGVQPVQVVVADGDGWANVGDALVAQDVIKDPSLFEKEALKLADGPNPGTWNLMTHLPAKTAAKLMTDPANRVVIRLTIPEGRRLADIYPILVKELGVTQEDIDAAVAKVKADPGVIGLNAGAGSVLEGFLFPDTYFLYPPIDTDVISVFKVMAARFNEVATELDLKNKAKALGLTVVQAVTVASIIEAEVFRDEDRPKVARVIFNRLEQKMKLQMDTTVNYGLNRSGSIHVTEAELSKDTPYNTYMHAGLPPTPIDNPGKAALQAAVNPAKGTWLYWTTVNLETGETRFETTWEEHEANVDVFRAWCAAHPDVCQ